MQVGPVGWGGRKVAKAGPDEVENAYGAIVTSFARRNWRGQSQAWPGPSPVGRIRVVGGARLPTFLPNAARPSGHGGEENSGKDREEHWGRGAIEAHGGTAGGELFCTLSLLCLPSASRGGIFAYV